MIESNSKYLVTQSIKGGLDTLLIMFLSLTVSTIYVIGASALARVIEILYQKSLHLDKSSVLSQFAYFLPLDV